MSITARDNLIKYLIRKKKVSLNDLMLKFGMSKVVTIDLINEINKSFKSDIIFSNQQGIYMTEQSKMICYNQIFRGKAPLFDCFESDERYVLIIIKLLVDQEFSSLQKLADFCLVSRNTILNDMKVIKKILGLKGLSVSYSRKEGYLISGSEFNIRNKLVTMVKQLLNMPAGKIILNEKQMVNGEEIFRLRKRLEKVESRIGITLTDEQLEDLPYILQFIIKRASHFQQNWTFQIAKYDIQNTIEFPEIKGMFWDYNSLKESDLLYLSLQILSSNMVESAFRISEGDEISLATDQFMDHIEAYLAIQFTQKNDLKEKLILHVGPAIYRSLIGFKINNPLVDEFIEQYEDIYNIVLKAVEPYEKIIQSKLSQEEVVYLSMIVLSWVLKTEEAESLFKAVVLCQSGTSVSKLLLSSLKQMFKEIDFVGAFAVRQYCEFEEVDFVFTTVPIETQKPTFLVPSLLDKDSRKTLIQQVYQEIQGNNKRITQKLLSSIEEFIPRENLKKVSDRITDIFQHQFRKPSISDLEKETDQFIFTHEHISIFTRLIEWDDLVDYALEPLLRRGSITEQYVKVVKDIFYSKYDNMLIARDVYLPHASPEYGVNQMDFQIIILKQPIHMPNGDDLKVVVTLAPDVDNKHVSTLIKLNTLFNDDNVFAQIYQEKDIGAIQAVLNN
ncbi:PRD domain-containing protein [Ornithinibacillus sp. L9]|uniref:Ascorbate-specific PTS system EIIA component n=1 Tax=Ornithinibacillus caprae TaxID=2678566 RepID=A0A6N8FD48_9BACI|nr:BglG family transcription antiterminator [Ornithinibacillus caprae]MUK87463.1 PRD domain-containing protein [Ornithinibacillus caprae]